MTRSLSALGMTLFVSAVFVAPVSAAPQ